MTIGLKTEKTQRFTSVEWRCRINNSPKLAVGQPNIAADKKISQITWSWMFDRVLSTHEMNHIYWIRFPAYTLSPHFPAFGLNTERSERSLRIQSDCGKMGTRITPNMDTFHPVLGGTYLSYVCWRLAGVLTFLRVYWIKFYKINLYNLNKAKK